MCGLDLGILQDMEKTCQVLRLGLMDYRRAWEMQNRMAEQIANGERPQTLLLLEHPHTYTFGRRGQRENLLWSEEELARRGISVHWVDRGGDVTYHGPGQLVGYPLLRLAQGNIALAPTNLSPRLPQADYVGYIRKLEKTLILALAKFGVPAVHLPGLTGVWVSVEKSHPAEPDSKPKPPAKIAAIGVKVDAKGVSRHGFALNVNPDMHYWEGIIGCGLKDYMVTSLAEWVQPVPSMEQVMDAVVSAFGWVFGMEMVEAERFSSSPRQIV
jgi:lipoyl(octanoyl) transferase